MRLEVTGLLSLIWLVVVIYAIIRIAGSTATPGAKALWIVLILLLPVIGVIIWFLLGPKS
ncbi:MAG: PLDc N-terminal domain-containing protein [Chromatiales bacterium]|nr:PLDc N-terminal domain-containing protein [Chromatiales bacterium]